MNSTRAEQVIIQPLCPGPALTSALGAPFVTYASRSATRVAKSGGAGSSANAVEIAKPELASTKLARHNMRSDRLPVLANEPMTRHVVSAPLISNIVAP